MQPAQTLKQVMKTLTLGCFAWLALGAGIAPAQERPTLRQALNQVLDEFRQRCPLAGGDKAPSDGNVVDQLMNRKMNWAVCECLPDRAREALRTVPDAELSRQVELPQVQEFLNPRAVQPCVGEVFRDLFGGENCRVMMGARGRAETADKVCGCLKPEVARFSDAEAAELGVSFVQYQSLAERARKAGKPAPPRSPLLQRMIDVIDNCSA